MNPFFSKIESLVQFNLIKTTFESYVFRIILTRPEKRNAFTPTMLKELAYALQYAQENDDIWCVVLEAEGPIFCAGMDLNVFQNPELDIKNENLPEPNREITIGDAFAILHKPCIAKVEGSVFAGGFLFICGCTFVVATNNAQFGLPEVKRGIYPMQVMASLMKIMPERKVLEICVLGKNYSANEAFDLGLVTHLVTELDSIDNVVNDLVNQILENSPFALKKGLEAYQQLPNLSENEKHEYLIGQLNAIRNSEDAKEGIAAFKEKRKPNWKNK